MANFEQIKEKVLATAGKVADKGVGLAKVAGDKAKLLGRITKLKTEIAMEKDSAKKNFAEIGKLYYEKHKLNPDPDMAQAIEEVNLSLEKVLTKQKEVAELKKQLADDYEEFAEEAEAAAKAAAETVEDVVDAVVNDDEEK